MKDKHYDSRRSRSPGRKPFAERQAPTIRWSGLSSTVAVEKLVPGGLGMARHEGQVVFVPGVLPGEEIRIELSEAKGGYRTGRLLELIKPSPDRVKPACPLYGRCGGCNLQHARYEAQVGYKRSMLEDCLRRQGGFGADGILPDISIETGEPWSYRNRQQYHILPDGQGLGFRQRESRTLIAVGDCPVASPEIRDWLKHLPVPIAPETPPASLQASEAEKGDEPDGDGRYPVFGANGQLRAGSGDFRLTLSGREIGFAVDGFFQSNVAMLEKLVALLTRWMAAAGSVGTVADLYCGCGVFSAFVPETCQQIVAVDNNPRNCQHARTNLAPGRCEVREEDVDAWLQSDDAGSVEAFILDPPRAGLSRRLLGHLLAVRAPHLFFVSCDPVTFCRDLKDLRASGYRIRELVLLDFYPQTSHIETACWLELEQP